jgi:hypothetical protein
VYLLRVGVGLGEDDVCDRSLHRRERLELIESARID